MQKLVEKTKQTLHVGHRTFRPTPNVRNPQMLEEAEVFSRYLTAFKTSLTRYHTQLDTFLATLPVVANGNLPRVWDQVEGTELCEPIRPNVSHSHPTRVGGEFDEGLLRDTREFLEHKFGHNVLKPIDHWQQTLTVVKGRMSNLESLRLDVDAKRRRAFAQRDKTIRDMERDGTDVDGEGPFRLGRATEDPVVAERRKEDFMRHEMYFKRKLDAAEASYNEQEQLVWETLSGLVRDAAWLKSYVAATLLAVKETLQASAIALGPCKLPLPSFGKSGLGHDYGAIGSPASYIADVPDVVKRGPDAALLGAPRSLKESAAESLRPKMLTAQPLQTSADLMTPRYAPVPPVIKGMAGVPQDMLPAPGTVEDSGASGSGSGGGIFGAVKSLRDTVVSAAAAGPIAPAGADERRGLAVV